MDYDIYHKPLMQEVISQLLHSAKMLQSGPVLRELQNISEQEARAIRRAILKITGFLDDSISNPYLGSIFDRREVSPLNAMLQNISVAYGVTESVAGTTGTTGLNVPAVMTLAGEGETILVGRDCHVSVIGGLCLSGARPIYIVSPFDHTQGILLPSTPDEVAELLDKHPDVQGAIFTIPTYHGLSGNISGIVAECHRRDIPVMVDEAHGPHFHFLGDLGFPQSAEDAGADMVTQSTHKVLSALNQGSLLHFNNVSLLERYLEYQCCGFQSTSFSFPLLMSVEHACEQMVWEGKERWVKAVESAKRLKLGLEILPGLRILGDEIIDGYRVTGLDPTRVTVNVKDTGMTGYQVSESLMKMGIIVEMATPDVVLFLISPSVTFEHIDDILEGFDRILTSRKTGRLSETFIPPEPPEQILTPRQAMARRNRIRVSKWDAVGRISAETIGCYPPGQAMVVYGEKITWEVVDYLNRAVDAGGHLKRILNDHFQKIEVLCEE
jgi:ornithine decarboxylase